MMSEDSKNNDKLKKIVEEILSGEHDLGEYYMSLSAMEFYEVEQMLKRIESKNISLEDSKFFMIGDHKVWFSNHAVQKYKERHIDLCEKNDLEIHKIMKKVASNSSFHEVMPKRKYVAKQILNHNFEKAKWYMDACGFVWIVVGDTLKTVHHNEAKRYE